MSKAFRLALLIAFGLVGCTESSDDQSGKEPTEIQPDGNLDDRTDGADDSTPIQTEPKCDTHERLCGGVCTDITNSVKHCGDCTTVCGADERCSGGQCVSDCPSGTEKCADSCADLMRDTGNCGACGTVCGQHMA